MLSTHLLHEYQAMQYNQFFNMHAKKQNNTQQKLTFSVIYLLIQVWNLYCKMHLIIFMICIRQEL